MAASSVGGASGAPTFSVVKGLLATLAVVGASSLVYVALRVEVTPPSIKLADSVELAREWVPLYPELSALGADALRADAGVRILCARTSWIAPGGAVRGTAAPGELMRSAVIDVVAELRRLPREMLAASDLRTVILVGAIQPAATHPPDGLASPSNHAFLVNVHSRQGPPETNLTTHSVVGQVASEATRVTRRSRSPSSGEQISMDSRH